MLLPTTEFTPCQTKISGKSKELRALQREEAALAAHILSLRQEKEHLVYHLNQVKQEKEVRHLVTLHMTKSNGVFVRIQ